MHTFSKHFDANWSQKSEERSPWSHDRKGLSFIYVSCAYGRNNRRVSFGACCINSSPPCVLVYSRC